MGVVIPQVITPSKASGAQVIDGSLGFSGTDQKLQRTPGSAGNQQTWTWSSWVKINPGQNNSVFSVHTGASDRLHLRIGSSYAILAQNTGSWDFDIRSNAVFRDTGWYHLVCVADFTNGTQNDRAILYVNGERLTLGTNTLPSNTTTNTIVNATKAHYIGESRSGTDFEGRMSQVYLIDGQALGPEYFGFTDPLTNTWKPKKYEGTFGTNGFYLPMDGNSPIGKDQSGNGNDWTPVNFGGSVALDNPQVSGARPILNTTPGGTQAGVGVFGSKENVGYAVTVYNDGGGNKFYIDGVKTASITGLIRGATYTFDTSDSTVGSTHPFRLSATSNGSHGGGSEYTNGVAAITGAATTITIPHDAPNTLYYYCTSHSGMGNDSSISGITTNEKLADQYASNIVFASPLVGANNDVCASIACTMTNKAITSNGNAAAANEASNFYSGSFEFDGTGDTLTSAQSSDLTMGTGDFTVECWARQSDTNHRGIWQISNTSGGLEQSSYGTTIAVGARGTDWQIYGAGSSTESAAYTIVSGQWYHLAYVRSSGTSKLYVNGTEVLSKSSDTTDYNGTYLVIGGYYNSSYLYNGYIQDFRVYKGVAKYTSNFVVPSRSPDILPDTPSGVAGDSKLTKITDGAVSFDGTNDTLSVPDHADFTFGSGDFTIEAFVYNRGTGYRSIVQKYGGSPSTSSWFWSMYNGQHVFYYYSGSNEPSVTSSQTHYNKWVHCAVSREGNTIRIFDNGELTGTLDVSSYDTMNDSTVPLDIGADYADNYDMDGFISNVRIVKGTALYTSRFTPPSAPLTNVTNTKLLCCQSNTSAGAAAVEPSGTGYTGTGAITLSSANLNAGAVANIVDGNTSTSANIRGAGSFVQMVFPQQQNGTLQVNVANGNDVGDDNIRVFIDGVEGTSFDVSSQQWYTIHTGNFTTVKLEHQGSTTGYIYGFRIGTGGDTIINGGITANGDAAATNFNPFNTDINTVRGQETGYPTWSPLVASTSTFSDGNLQITTQASGYVNDLVTMRTPAGTGKWYWEFVQTARTGTDYTLVGMLPDDNTYKQGSSDIPQNCGGIGLYIGQNGVAYVASGAATAGTTSATFDVGDVLGWAYDAENGTVECYKNGVSQGTQFTNVRTDTRWTFCVTDYDNTTVSTFEINFGQKPFKFSPPDGFQPLNDANTRPETVIARPDQYVGVTTYSGNSGDGLSTTQDIDVGLNPDLIWIKHRNGTNSNLLTDTVRGLPNTLIANSNAATNTNASRIPALIYNGFRVGDRNEVNDVGGNYVAWCWKAGGNKNTFNVDDVGYASAAAAGLTAGDTTPTGASVGTKQGFSIIKYTGPNDTNNHEVPHGLSQAPDFIIAKNLDATYNWDIYHSSLADDAYLIFTTAATRAQGFNGRPTSTVFKTEHDYSTNENQEYIAYCWHDVPGLQKFGEYVGNGNANGAFIELGFRPKIIIAKASTGGGSVPDWLIFDSERDSINPADKNLSANYAGQEQYYTGGLLRPTDIDILSNGFKIRNTRDANNANGSNFIYAAWAEAPSVDLFGGGANAR